MRIAKCAGDPDLCGPQSGNNSPYTMPPMRDAKPKTKVSIGIGDFQWCSLLTSNGPCLVALRDVTTPEGVLVQGFVISNDAVAETLKNAALPARFLPSASAGTYVVAARLESTGWYIVVSAAKEFDAAHLRVHLLKPPFWRIFLGRCRGRRHWRDCAWCCWCGSTEQLARQRSQFAGVRRARTAHTTGRPAHVQRDAGRGIWATRRVRRITPTGWPMRPTAGPGRFQRTRLYPSRTRCAASRPEPGDLAATRAGERRTPATRVRSNGGKDRIVDDP